MKCPMRKITSHTTKIKSNGVIDDVYKDIEAAQIILAGAEAKLKKLEKGDR